MRGNREIVIINWAERAAEVLAFRYAKYILIILLFGYITPPLSAQQLPVSSVLHSGEDLSYDVYFKWGLIFSHAGKVNIATTKINHHKEYGASVSLLFRSHGMMEKLYKVRDSIDIYYSPNSTLLYSEKRTDEKNYKLHDKLWFCYQDTCVNIKSKRYTPTKTKIDTCLIAKNYVFDLLGSLIYLRGLNWNNLQIGNEYPFDVAIGKDLVHVRYRYTGQEIVSHAKKKYNTRHFYIDIFDEAFSQSKEAAEIWVGDDPNHIPIKARAKLKIGAAEAYLKEANNIKYPLRSCVISNE